MRFSKASNPSSNNLLDRVSRSSSHSSDLTKNQSQVDQLVGGFVEQATDWKSLAAMMAGGLAYRLTRVGVMGMGSSVVLRPLSVVVGLGSEVTAFELTNRTLHTITGGETPPLQHPSPVTNHPSPNLWSWSGPNGLRQGFLSSFITFGTLKSLGHLSQGQNVFLQHGAQDMGMVLGHQLAYKAGLGEKPEGTLTEQFLHAEVTNLQLSASMGLAHSLTGGRILALERGLDLSLKNGGAGPQPVLSLSKDGRPEGGTHIGVPLQPSFAMVEGLKNHSRFFPPFHLAEKKGGESFQPKAGTATSSGGPKKTGEQEKGEALLQKLRDPKKEVSESSINELVTLGSPAVEPLLQVLKSRDKKILAKAIWALGEIGDTRAVEPLARFAEEGQIPLEAMRATAEVMRRFKDPRMALGLARLLKISSSQEVQSTALQALKEMGLPALKALVQVFKTKKHRQNRDCTNVINALGELGDPRVVDLLIPIIRSDLKEYKQGYATAALAGLKGPHVMKPLLDLLLNEKERDDIRVASALALVKSGGPPAIKPALNILRRAIIEERRHGSSLVSNISGPVQHIHNPYAVEGLIEWIDHPERHIQFTAVRALGNIKDPQAVDPLIPLLGEEEGDVFREVASALSQINEDFKPLYSMVENIGWIDENVFASLWDTPQKIKILAHPQFLIPLIHLMSINKKNVGGIATKAILEIGKSGINFLIPLLKNPDPRVRARGARFLGEIGGFSNVEWLNFILKETPEELLLSSATKTMALRAIRPLSQALENPDRSIRSKAVKVLDKLMEQHKEAALGEWDTQQTESLLKMLTDKEPSVRASTLSLLGRMKDPSTFEVLLESLKDPVASVRLSVCRALREYYSLGFGNRIFSAILEHLEKEKDDSVRAEIVEILGLGGERAVEPLIRRLEDVSRDVRNAAKEALLKIGDPRAIEPLFKAFGKREDWWDYEHSIVSRFAEIDLGKTDQALVSYLKNHPECCDIKEYDMDRLKSFGLQATRTWIEKQNEGDKFRETHEEKITEITEAIREKLSEALGLDMDHQAAVLEGNEGSYGSVTMGLGFRQSLRLEHRLELRVVPLDNITIEVGDSLEEMKERMRTLNFLVHHEVAHVIQKELKIKRPKVDLDSFQHLDPKEIRHHANEILIDKLGFDAARKIYVHGEGDVLFEEGMREAIAIQAYISLSNIILQNLKSGNHTLSEENIARFIAVAHEMAQSEEINEKTRKGLQTLTKDLETWVSSDQDPEKMREIHLLIGKYRELFRSSALP